MPANEFSLRIRIDGAQARADASRIRRTIEAELTKIATVSFDTKSLEKVMKVAGKLSIAGVIEIAGLEIATERIKLLQAMASQKLVIRGSVDIGGLKAARAQMQGIRDDAGSLGRAIATGLGRQQASLERHLTDLQSRITGLVRAGEKMPMDAPLEGLERMGQGLADDEKKAYSLFLSMRTLNAESEELNKRFAQLGATKFMPLGAGGMQSLKRLFAIFESPHYRGKIKKAVTGIVAELAPLSQRLQVAMDEATTTAEAARGPLVAEIEQVQAEMEAALAAKPIRPTVAGELAGWQEATAAWELSFGEMERRYLELTSRLDQIRSVALTGDAESLKSEISLRRNMLQAPLEEEFEFWREWSMTSVEEIAESLRHTGQTAAADALREMYAIWEARKKVESQLKRGAGRLRKGAQAELPAGAAGTMVDFIASERVLEQSAAGATEQLKAQWAQLGRLTKRLDSAAMAADGLSESERMAFQRMQQLAAREIKKRTPLTTTTLEESGAVAQEVLVRLSKQAAEVREAMLAALAPPGLPAAVAATVGDPDIEQAAARPVQGILGLWERLRMRLVGRSIVPEMVQEINLLLAQIGQEPSFAVIEEEAKRATAAVIQGEKRQTATVVSQVKYRQKQKEEAAKRATLKAKSLRQGEIEAAKAVSRSQIEMAKATARQEIEAAKRVTAVTTQQLKERDRAQREAQVASRQRGEAERMAADLGIQWDTVVQKTLDAGYSMETVVGALRRVQREQRQVGRGAKRTADGYDQATTSVGRFVQELNRARMSSHGIAMILNDVSRVGRTLQFTGTALAGSLTMAGRSYLELATQTDIASRSLLLNEELTQEMRDQVINMSAAMGMLDPQATAKGVTIWAQATGQAVESSEDLLRVLKQTVPVQQLASLATENIETVTDGTAATLRQFGLTLDDTGRVVAIFNKIADDTLATVGDMSEAFKYVGPQAYEMGESVEETAAILGIMADKNIRGSTAGRAYRMMLLSLVEPSTKAKEALEETFAEEQPFYDAEGRFVGLTQVIDMLAAATEDATDEERELLLATLFTANAIPAVTGLVEEQTEARSRGINAARAEAKLLAGVIDEEVRMYGKMKQQTEGTTIAMMGAVELWERQLDDWEESDVYRVKQAEMRWKGFWLAIGEQAVSTALPAIQEGARLLEYVTSLIQSGGPLGGLIGVLVPAGGAMIAIGTLVSAVTGVGRAIFGLRMVATALKTTMEGQMVAGGRFQGQVVSAGEQFRAIVTGAAQQAAAIEQGGAKAEVATEIAGAEAETAIEVAGAEAEVIIEKTGAMSAATMFSSALIALGVGEMLSQALTGQSMTGWFTTREGVAAGEMRATGMAGEERSAMQAELERVVDNLAVVTRFYEEGMFDPGLIFGTGAGYAQFEEVMGGRTRALSGAAVADKIAELETLRDALRESLTMLPVVLRDLDGAAGDVEIKIGKLTGGLYDLDGSLGDVVKLTDEEVKAAELYVEMLQKQAEALKKFNDQMAAALSDLNKDLAEMAADYHDRRQELERSWVEEDLRSAEDHNDRKAKAAADHAVKMRRMDEDHLLRMRDLARGRDAYGMRKELQQHKLQRSRAEEDFARSQGDSDVQFERQRERRRLQHEQELADARAEHEEEKAERKAEYEERKIELQAQHEEDQARLTKEYFDKINAEIGFFTTSKATQALYHAAMLADATTFLSANRAIWQDHLRNLPVPSRTTPTWPGQGPQPYQAGGYASRTGPAYLHAGEFVLNPGATRQAERSLGPLTQAKLMAGLAGGGAQRPVITMQLTQDYTFHGSLTVEERRWFRETARDEARGQFEQALRSVPVRD